MREGHARGLKVLVLLLVLGAAWWLVWKNVPPYEPGFHSQVAEAKMVQGVTGPGPAPRIGNCEIFPADNIWNTPIDDLPKDKMSEAYIAGIGPSAKLHPDFGPSAGIPYTDIPVGTKHVKVDFEYRDDSDLANYPIPPDAPIEGGSRSTGDRHVLLIDQHNCLLYELYDAHPNADGSWHAGSGIRMDLTSNALREAGKTSADAAGLPILPGLVRYDEVLSGEIRHALRFTIPHTQAAYLWPARHKASPDASPRLAPMGVRFRLRANYDISTFSKTDQVILTALKRYGMILADNGGAMFVSGVPDKRWDNSDLHKLTVVTAADFEAVDESDLQLLPDSARVDR